MVMTVMIIKGEESQGLQDRAVEVEPSKDTEEQKAMEVSGWGIQNRWLIFNKKEVQVTEIQSPVQSWWKDSEL